MRRDALRDKGGHVGRGDGFAGAGRGDDIGAWEFGAVAVAHA